MVLGSTRMVFRMEKMRKPAINSISFVEAWLRLLHAVWQRGFCFFLQFGSVDHFDAGHHKPWHGAVGGSRIRGARVVQPDVSDDHPSCRQVQAVWDIFRDLPPVFCHPRVVPTPISDANECLSRMHVSQSQRHHDAWGLPGRVVDIATVSIVVPRVLKSYVPSPRFLA